MLSESVLQHLGHSQLEVSRVSNISPDGFISVVRSDGTVCNSVMLLDTHSVYAVGTQVLIGWVEHFDAPIVLGPLAERLPTRTECETQSLKLEAAEELEIRCGKSSLVMRKNGKVLLKGTQIVSNASGTNRLKGGAVAIN